MASQSTGTLYLVSTPIGNLEDITSRALRILREVELIAAEDTRHTGLLLNHYHIHGRLESYHDHNKEKRLPGFIDMLKKGKSIAVVSDAGTPGISDPAYHLVRGSIEARIPVVPIPGPTAAVAALTISGLPTDRFVFEGFLPAKKGRKSRVDALKEETRTLVLYEAPHRLLKTLHDLKTGLGNREIAVCRELTKKFEEILRGSISEMIGHFSSKKPLGEFVLIIKGRSKHDATDLS